LQLAFEKLKRRLQAEGLFAQERKRPLPRFPQRLGLVTSPTGAAIRDVLHVIARRNPSLHVILVPCRVQGEGAAGEIAAGIRLLNEWNVSLPPAERLDLILVTRGGGSLEDLWAFNEEEVARAIFESTLPVVSAIGHEIDFTISDFVADLRAATPSAAAEIITEGAFASRQFVAEASEHLRYLMRRRISDERENLLRLIQRLRRVHPRRFLQEHAQRLDDLQSALIRCARFGLRTRSSDMAKLHQRLVRLQPSLRLRRRREELLRLRCSLAARTHLSLSDARLRLEHAATELRLLSPLNVLERGYSMTLDGSSGRVIRSAAETRPGQRLQTKLGCGEITSVVEGKERDT